MTKGDMIIVANSVVNEHIARRVRYRQFRAIWRPDTSQPIGTLVWLYISVVIDFKLNLKNLFVSTVSDSCTSFPPQPAHNHTVRFPCLTHTVI